MPNLFQRIVNSLFGTGDDSRYLESIGDPYVNPMAKSGEKVSARTAMGLPAFRQGVTLLSGDVAKVPLVPYRINANGATEVDKSHPSYRLTAWRPNSMQSAYEFKRHLMFHAIIYSHGYAWIRRRDGQPFELIPLLSDRTRRVYFEDVDQWRIETQIDGKLVYFRDDEILHVSSPFAGVDGFHDNQLIVDCRDAIGLGLAANGFASRFFRKGGRMGGVLEIPAGFSEKAKGSLEEGWRKTYEQNEGQFATVILRDNAKFHSAQFKPDEGQMTESRQEQVKEVARILNIPAHKLGHDGRTAYNSLEMEERAYVNSTLSHWFKVLEGQCDMWLLTEEEKANMTHRFGHDLSELIATDSETRADVAKIYVETGIKTVNEIRTEMSLPALEENDTPSESSRDLVEAIQKIYLGVGKVLSTQEAREILNRNHGADLTGDYEPTDPTLQPVDDEPGEPTEAPQEPVDEPEPSDDGEQEDMAQDAIRTHLEALIDHQRLVAVKEIVQRVKDNAKRCPGSKFVSWYDSNFESLCDGITQRHLGHTLRAYSIQQKRDLQEVTSSVMQDPVLSIKVVIDKAIEQTSSPMLNRAVQAKVDKWLKNEFTKVK